jgi:hypothetical protein
MAWILAIATRNRLQRSAICENHFIFLAKLLKTPGVENVYLPTGGDCYGFPGCGAPPFRTRMKLHHRLSEQHAHVSDLDCDTHKFMLFPRENLV